jgi:hypothetical protein
LVAVVTHINAFNYEEHGRLRKVSVFLLRCLALLDEN